MRTKAPPLFPLFRSRGQARLLSRLFVTKNADIPMTTLAKEIGMSRSRVFEEAERLEGAGLIRSRRVGNTRILEADPESPFQPELETLLLKAFGPVPVLEQALADIAGVDFALIYGSWANRYLGFAGEAAADIDLLVVGDPDVAEVRRVSRAAALDLGREVNATIVTADEWANDESGFLRTLRSRPFVTLAVRKGG